MQGEESHEPLCGAQCGIRSGKRPHATVALRERRRSDDDKGLHRNGAARQFTADFLGSKVLAGRQAEPSLVPMAIIARTTSPGFSGRRAALCSHYSGSGRPGPGRSHCEAQPASDHGRSHNI
jgi:hypothetical protein